MPPKLLVPVGLGLLVAGAFYCEGHQALRSDLSHWSGSLLWALYGVLPWLLVFEYVKRREWDADRALPFGTIALLFGLTICASVAAHLLTYNLLLGRTTHPIALQFVRRLPAMAITLVVLLLSRREQHLARQRLGLPGESAAGEADDLLAAGPAIRWIRGADNYLELHQGESIAIRRLTMRDASRILEPLGFVRIHRSLIVNRNHVSSIVPQSRRPAVRMKDGTLLPTGRAFAGNLRQLS